MRKEIEPVTKDQEAAPTTPKPQGESKEEARCVMIKLTSPASPMAAQRIYTLSSPPQSRDDMCVFVGTCPRNLSQKRSYADADDEIVVDPFLVKPTTMTKKRRKTLPAMLTPTFRTFDRKADEPARKRQALTTISPSRAFPEPLPGFITHAQWKDITQEGERYRRVVVDRLYPLLPDLNVAELIAHYALPYYALPKDQVLYALLAADKNFAFRIRAILDLLVLNQGRVQIMERCTRNSVSCCDLGAELGFNLPHCLRHVKTITLPPSARLSISFTEVTDNPRFCFAASRFLTPLNPTVEPCLCIDNHVVGVQPATSFTSATLIQLQGKFPSSLPLMDFVSHRRSFSTSFHQLLTVLIPAMYHHQPRPSSFSFSSTQPVIPSLPASLFSLLTI